MNDGHIESTISRMRKLIAERDEKIMQVQAMYQEYLREIGPFVEGIRGRLDGSEAEVMGLLRTIVTTEEAAETVKQEHATFLATLKQEYEEAIANSTDHKTEVLAVIATSLVSTRAALSEAEETLAHTKALLNTQIDKRQSILDACAEQTRKLRNGKYQEAKTRLPELEARLASRAATTSDASKSENQAIIQAESAMVCQACQKIAKPWVLSTSGAALCLKCATGK